MSRKSNRLVNPSMEELEKFVRESGRDLDRLIIIRPNKSDDVSYLDDIYASTGKKPPPSLAGWEDHVDRWCDAYRRHFKNSEIVEINLKIAVYLFDMTLERVVLAFALSSAALHKRDVARMRRFPDFNVGVRAALGPRAFLADRGHFLGHACGGQLDINLFAQRRELNRGWSTEGKRFRAMEQFVAKNYGTFLYHRPIYDDNTGIPSRLDYGVLREDTLWWVDRFRNK